MNRSFIAWLLMASVSIVLMIAGKEIAGRQGLLAAFILSLCLNSLVYFYGEIRLKTLFKGRKLEGRDPYNLNSLVAELSMKLNMPQPEIIICELGTPTAFSTGHNLKSSCIILSYALVDSLEADELRAVVAFELHKLKSNFSFSGSICSAIAAGSIGTAERLDKIIFFGKDFKHELGPISGLICPIVTWFIRLVQNRQSYFDLDKKVSILTGAPRALASSLWKLDSLVSTQPNMVPKDTAHLFFINPLPRYGWSKMFQTQPSAKERIEQLIGQYPI